MKRKLSYFISVFAVSAMLLSPVAALAHGDELHDDSNTSSNTRSEKKKETAAEFKKRLDDQKTKYKVKLAAAQKLALKGKCKPAQAVVGKLQTKFGNSVTKRTQAYEQLQKNLDGLIEKLKAKDVDTATLESQITALKAKIATYSTDLTAYKDSLADLKEVDCAADPDAFQAALESARAAHQKLVADVVAIKTYVKDTIKPTLVTIRKSIETAASTSNSGSDATNSSNTSGSN